MPKLELVNADFGEDVNKEIEWFVENQLESLITSHQDLHKNKLPRWRKAYLGRPIEETRNFPFPNAANTVVQVIGETVDTMVARVMGLIWATHPLWAFQNYIKAQEDQEKKQNEEDRKTLEDFMDVMGIEPTELNLHEVEALWYTDASKLGTGFVKLSVEDQVEAVVTGYTEASKSISGTEKTIYAGPRVSNLRHEDVVVDARTTDFERADFVAARRTLTRFQLEERGFLGHYDPAKVEHVLGHPDRHAPEEAQR